MQTQLADKIRTLTANHDDLTALITGDTFGGFDLATQERLLDMHRIIDSAMRALTRQVDALDTQVADLLFSLEK
jgi:hypothetical protein